MVESSPIKTTTARRKDISSERVVEAAAELFQKCGYDATSMRDIAKAVDMKAGSLYYHFQSKEELLDIVLERGIAGAISGFEEALASLQPDAPFLDRFRVVVRSHLRAMADTGTYMNANRALLQQVPEAVRERHYTRRRRYDDLWRALIEQGIRDGDVREGLHYGVVRMLILGALSWTNEWMRPERNSLGGIEQIAVDLFSNGFLLNDPRKKA